MSFELSGPEESNKFEDVEDLLVFVSEKIKDAMRWHIILSKIYLSHVSPFESKEVLLEYIEELYEKMADDVRIIEKL